MSRNAQASHCGTLLSRDSYRSSIRIALQLAGEAAASILPGERFRSPGKRIHATCHVHHVTSYTDTWLEYRPNFIVGPTLPHVRRLRFARRSEGFRQVGSTTRTEASARPGWSPSYANRAHVEPTHLSVRPSGIYQRNQRYSGNLLTFRISGVRGTMARSDSEFVDRRLARLRLTSDLLTARLTSIPESNEPCSDQVSIYFPCPMSSFARQNGKWTDRGSVRRIATSLPLCVKTQSQATGID